MGSMAEVVELVFAVVALFSTARDLAKCFEQWRTFASRTRSTHIGGLAALQTSLKGCVGRPWGCDADAEGQQLDREE